MEVANGILPRACLLHRLGRSCDGSNYVDGKLRVYQVLGNKCTSWPGFIVSTSSHATHSTLGG
jgi:hypothetical protein